MCKKINRRKFLGQSSCAALGLTTFFSTWMDMQMASAASLLAAPPQGGGYKAMVCILLSGGNDSFNMLVPRSQDSYNEYAGVRSNLALSQGELLPLNFTDTSGKEFGMHPSMPEMADLFNSGKLSFISNVGSLVEPTTKIQMLNNQVSLPLGLYSHEDQVKHWQTSIPNERSSIGWGGRMADLLHESANGNLNLSMNISLGGSNIFQAGNETIEYAISPTDGSQGINGYGETGTWSELRNSVIDNLLDQQYQDIFKQTYANTIRYAQNSHELFSGALANFDVNTEFPANELGDSLKMIARTIGIRESLGMSRQTFFVNFGGWDHHDELPNNHMNMLSVVSQALGQFNAALEELGVGNDVITFTISDFARTLTSNGNGTDHAWGGNQFVMGGGINGGQIFGSYPDLYLDNDLDVGNGNGVLIPTVSTDEYFAELAQWFGVSNSDLDTILPNIGNFYDVNSGQPPIGFTQI